MRQNKLVEEVGVERRIEKRDMEQEVAAGRRNARIGNGKIVEKL